VVEMSEQEPEIETEEKTYKITIDTYSNNHTWIESCNGDGTPLSDEGMSNYDIVDVQEIEEE